MLATGCAASLKYKRIRKTGIQEKELVCSLLPHFLRF